MWRWVQPLSGNKLRHGCARCDRNRPQNYNLPLCPRTWIAPFLVPVNRYLYRPPTPPHTICCTGSAPSSNDSCVSAFERLDEKKQVRFLVMFSIQRARSCLLAFYLNSRV